MTRIWSVPLALAGLALVAFAGMVLAENIDPNNNNSQFAWSENAGWLNAEPANCANCGVHVTNTGLTGYVWGENIGWINLSCRNNSTCTGPAGNWGVTRNPSTGALSGYAFAENAGWINFSCQNNGTCAGPAGNWGVGISPSTGIFSGYAWGENIGWISFGDTSPVAYKVQTFADRDADGPLDDADNCPAVANGAQTNGDSDAFGDVCDACPATADPNACPDDDNDGFTDVNEGGTPLCNGVNNDAFDAGGTDNVADDGCPGGPSQVGSFSEAQFKIGTNGLDPCGNNGWPLDLNSSGFSANKVDIVDLGTFVTGVRKLNTNPGETGFDSRWDLVPGTTTAKFINIVDMATMVTGVTARPPMLGGVKALGGPGCPFAP
jgi:hypothetical protein